MAFIDLCIDSLNNEGTLIAIVPSSIISSESGINLRKKLFNNGFFKYIYELPSNTFLNIDASFYILIYEKNVNKKSDFILRNLDEPINEIKVSNSSLYKYRMDYSFVKSNNFYKVLMSKFHSHKHKVLSLNDISRVKRGVLKSDYNREKNIHTTALSNDINIIKKEKGDMDFFCNYSICLKRVSRKSNYSFSLISKSLLENCTDCLFIIDLIEYDAFKLIFSLRALYSNINGELLLLKGSGAKYISIKELREIEFIDLSLVYQNDFLNYKKYLLKGDYQSCTKIEEKLFYDFSNKY